MKSNIPLSSATLLRFYKAWMANHPEMDRTTNGLCNCLEAYVGSYSASTERWRANMLGSLKYEMRKQFECAKLDYNFPFNYGYGVYALISISSVIVMMICYMKCQSSLKLRGWTQNSRSIKIGMITRESIRKMVLISMLSVFNG